MRTFLIADVSSPILGADFLHYFELVLDFRNKCLRGTKTKLQSVGHLKHANLHSVQIPISADTIHHKHKFLPVFMSENEIEETSFDVCVDSDEVIKNVCSEAIKGKMDSRSGTSVSMQEGSTLKAKEIQLFSHF
ncbi:transposon Ty3-I Gag-Pol polyprotein [Trichonephila clavipes]|uniref:Transposon Ty3-I Gag-Pol polyprotein n=1 Tax=Trichonephila clavipes TaxID=2585209 RepID=A0A8X6VJC4_TRICX|nr:transposon Ty3-I Gag-Pol polyprotein [Trichonephila clavipes]